MYFIGEIFGGIIVKQVRLTKTAILNLEARQESLKLTSIRPLLVPFTGHGHGRRP